MPVRSEYLIDLLPPDLYRRLRISRLRLGIMQDDIARYSGCDQSLISRWEGGSKRIGLSDLLLYAQALGLAMIVHGRYPEDGFSPADVEIGVE